MKSLATIVLCLFALDTIAQNRVSGYVYDDLNKNGKREGKEKGVAGVSVSNGLEVVRTDAQGRYVLPIGNDNIIFISKPAGYQVPMNASKLPQFYVIHKPQGSPVDYKYPGVSPTKKLPKEISFPLYQSPESDDYTALIFGDPQPYSKEELDYFAKAIVTEVEGVKNVRLGISLGDIVGDDLSLHMPYVDIMKRIGLPWYNVMGNHDMNYEAVADSLSDESFEAHFGPANYSFNYGKVHYLILDDILYPDPRDGKGYWGGFTKRQLDYIENDLKLVDKSSLVILSFHIPLQQYNDSYRVEDRQRLFEILKPFHNTLVLSAHTHLQRNDFYSSADGWGGDKPFHEYNAGTTSGDWYSGELNETGVPISTMRDGTPKGYAYIHFKGSQYVIDYKVAGKPKEFQMEVFAPKVIPTGNRATSSGVYVNFFMGREGDVIEYKLGNAEWKAMEYVKDADPSFLEKLHAWDYTEALMPGRRPSNAVDCTHLWRGSFSNDLPVGDLEIQIRAKDMYGRTFTAVRKAKVEPSKAVR